MQWRMGERAQEIGEGRGWRARFLSPMLPSPASGMSFWPRMNLPNAITLSRIPLMFVIVGLMYYAGPGAAALAFALFLAAAVGDWYDGFLARRRGLVSNFGK